MLRDSLDNLQTLSGTFQWSNPRRATTRVAPTMDGPAKPFRSIVGATLVVARRGRRGILRGARGFGFASVVLHSCLVAFPKSFANKVYEL